MGLILQPLIYDGAETREWFDKHPKDVFWFAAQNGFFVHRPMAIGRAILPHVPKHLKEWPHKGVLIDYEFPLLPKEIMAQAHDFFRRIWNKYKSEAEVLLVYNDATKEVRIFVPPQRCQHGGVHSAFNPEHIKQGWQLIGSIHSHCNFGAGHSSTDTGDASEFDGIHITIGHVDTDTPSFATMVMINKGRLDYKIEEIADVSDLKSATAPEWWDRYVLQDQDPDPRILKTWMEFRPPEKPKQQPWQNHNRGFNRQFLSQNDNWDVNYGNPSGDHPYSTECDCKTWDQHVPLKYPGSTRKTKGGSHFSPGAGRGYNASEDRRFDAAKKDFDWNKHWNEKYNSKRQRKNAKSSTESKIIDVINEFHGVLLDMEELGLFPSDLVMFDELIRPDDIPALLDAIGLPTENEVKNVTPEEPKQLPPGFTQLSIADATSDDTLPLP